MSRTHSRLPYVETEFAISTDPLLVCDRLARTYHHCVHVVYEREGAWSVALGVNAQITLDRNEVRVRHGDTTRRLPLRDPSNPTSLVAAVLDDLPISEWRAYGWASFELGYADLGHTCDGGDGGDPDEPALLSLVVPRSEVRVASGRALIRSTSESELRRLAELVALPHPEPGYRASPLEPSHFDAPRYRESVRAAVEEIGQRKFGKVILSRCLPLDRDIDLVGSFVLGRRNNTPARSFLLNLGGVRAAGFSPEIVVEVTPEGRVVTQPLAGTRALTACEVDNERARDDLCNDPKEIFEHAISVRAACAELAGLCPSDSVVIEDFMTVQRRGSVQHLGSRISGRLSVGCGPWDAFAALFPAITASGIPKESACAAIRRHETQPRGLYGGAVLTVGSDGSLDAALVLRAIYQRSGRSWLRAGAGVVAQSRPEREFEETCEKLRSVALYLVPKQNTTEGPVPTR